MNENMGDVFPDFPILTPMLVIGFKQLKARGFIPRSDEARRDRLVEEFDASKAGQVAIFVSHRWWQTHTNSQGIPTGHTSPQGLDEGRPDYTEGENKDLKFRTVVAGVEALIKKQGLDRDKVFIWMDWFAIDQDSPELKLKGIQSLIKYVTMCTFMLIPVEVEEEIPRLDQPHDAAGWDPGSLPDYGSRAWCRLEWLVFMLWAEMSGVEPLQLHAINLKGQLNHYKSITFRSDLNLEDQLPWQGDVSAETDRLLIRDVQESMISAFVPKKIWQCNDADSLVFHLYSKLLGDEHVPTLIKALQLKQPKKLDISRCPRVTVAGYHQLAHFLATDDTLEHLVAEDCFMDEAGASALFSAMKTNTGLKVLSLARNVLTAGAAHELACLLATNTRLESLDVSSCGLDAAGASALGSALKANKGLKDLHLNGNYDAGAKWHAELAAALATHATLKELDMQATSMTDEGATAIALALRAGGALEILNASFNFELSATGRHELVSACEAGNIELDIESDDEYDDEFLEQLRDWQVRGRFEDSCGDGGGTGVVGAGGCVGAKI